MFSLSPQPLPQLLSGAGERAIRDEALMNIKGGVNIPRCSICSVFAVLWPPGGSGWPGPDCPGVQICSSNHKISQASQALHLRTFWKHQKLAQPAMQTDSWLMIHDNHAGFQVVLYLLVVSCIYCRPYTDCIWYFDFSRFIPIQFI